MSQPLWNVYSALGIRRDAGVHLCVGKKGGTADECGWRIRGDTGTEMGELIEELAAGEPSDALRRLNELAGLGLCHHHGGQKARVVRIWASATNNLVESTQNSSHYSSSPAELSTPAPRRVLPEISNSSSSVSHVSSITLKANDLMEQFLQLQKQLRDMQLQVKDLERENQTLRATRKANVTVEREEDGFVNVKAPHESLTDSRRSKKTFGDRILRKGKGSFGF